MKSFKVKFQNFEISLLLVVDDFVILALSKQGLQDKIDLLEKYCKDWRVKFYLKESKILIFSKQRAAVKRLKVYFKKRRSKLLISTLTLGSL